MVLIYGRSRPTAGQSGIRTNLPLKAPIPQSLRLSCGQEETHPQKYNQCGNLEVADYETCQSDAGTGNGPI